MISTSKLPILAVRHRHELFSSLTLRHDTENVKSWQQLELQQHRFWSSSSW